MDQPNVWTNKHFTSFCCEVKRSLFGTERVKSDGEDGNTRDLPLAFGQQTFGYPLVNRCKQHVWLENQHLEFRL